MRLTQKINNETLKEYLKWRFPKRERGSDQDISDLVTALQGENIYDLKKLDQIVDNNIKQFLEMEKNDLDRPARGRFGREKYVNTAVIVWILSKLQTEKCI